jgi:cell division protein FtsQ
MSRRGIILVNSITSSETRKVGMGLIIKLLLTLSFIPVAFYTSTRCLEKWQVREISILGLQNKESLLRLISLRRGVSIFKVNVRKLQSKLAQYPQFKKVAVWKEFPARVKIKVEERQPIATVEIDGKVKLGIDKERVLFPLLGESYPELPRLVGIKEKDLIIGQVNFAPSLWLSVALINIFQETSPALSKEILKIDFSQIITPIVYLKPGIPLKISLECFNRKTFTCLGKIFEMLKLKEKKIDYIDLRFKNQIIVKYRKNSLEEKKDA